MLIAFLYYFSVLVVLGTSPAASVSTWLVDSSERLLSYAQQLVSEHLRLVVGSCVDSKSISCCLAEIVCRSRSGVGTVCGIVCQRVDCSRNQFGGVDCFENSSRVSLGGKDLIFI